ncbi:glycosyltransferase family 2 protein [Alteromonas sp. ZYF713]|nr:glycosyltransferase family 2 protein [Alteromonas sp. ZYF713]
MMAIKAGVGVVPKPLRNFAKKNPALTSFYSSSLQKSGLFYGFPSKKKLRALYAKRLDHQKSHIKAQLQKPEVHNPIFSIAIVGSQVALITRTLESISVQSDSVDLIFTTSEVPGVSSELSKKCIAGVSDLSEAALQKSKTPLLLLNAGDELHGQALAYLSKRTVEGLLYVDTDQKLSGSLCENARLLPDWNPDYQLSNAYVRSGVILSAKLRNSLGQTSAKTIAGLVTQLWLLDSKLSIEHVPLSLVHHKENKQAKLTELQEIAGLIESQKTSANTVEGEQINIVQWPVINQPLVSLIIPTKNAKQLVKECIESILTKSTYQNYEILLVDNNSDEPESLAYFDELNQHEKIRVLKYPHPFNYSAINNFAAQQAKGEVIGLINNDIEVITPDWLEYMLGHALREDIGCVGAKLMYGDDRIQHAGVVLGYGGGAGHAHKYFPRYHPGYMNRLIATHNYSAVTAACLLVKKSLFDAVGGLNESDLTVAFNDVDFCLRVRAQGVRNLYCAEAELYHHESVSRGLDVSKEKMARFNAELDYLKSNWAEVIAHDPAYNPNLTLRRENFSIKDQKEWNELVAQQGN